MFEWFSLVGVRCLVKIWNYLGFGLMKDKDKFIPDMGHYKAKGDEKS